MNDVVIYDGEGRVIERMTAEEFRQRHPVTTPSKTRKLRITSPIEQRTRHTTYLPRGDGLNARWNWTLDEVEDG